MAKKIKFKIANIKLSKIVSLLGKILGFVVKEQEGLLIYNKIEEIRSLSKASRGTKNKKKIKLNETRKFRKLIKVINKLKPKESLVVARSFSKFLNFSNLAESLDSVHKIDEGKVQKKQDTNEFTLLENAIDRLLKQKSISKENFFKVAKSLKIDLVLTAHPTEVKRRTLIQKYHKITEVLEQRDLLKKYPSKLKILDKKLYDEFSIIWNTDDLKRSKPTPLEEARWGLAIIEDSLWETIPKVYRRLNNIFVKNLGKGLPKNFNPIEFGSWMGGDRDGNPYVTSEVTKEVILLSRWEAAKLYEKELTKLIRSLSIAKCSKKILKKTGKTFEPYRVFLRPLRKKIRSTYTLIEQHLVNKKPLDKSKLLSSREEILKPLRVVRESLEQNQSENIASGDLLDLMRRTKCFGINLARLDIRQESSRHSQLISELLKNKLKIDYSKWSEKKKLSFLSSSIKSKKNLINNFSFKNKENKEVWNTFKILADGIITRFTGLSKADWNNAMKNAETEYNAKYSETAPAETPTDSKVAV